MTRPLVERMLRAVEDRVAINEARAVVRKGGVGHWRARARLNESSEILGILRNVVKAWDEVQK